MIVEIPDELRKLQGCWFPPNFSPIVEDWIRFSAQIAEPNASGQKRVRVWRSGESGTMGYDFPNPQDYALFEKEVKEQYLSSFGNPQGKKALEEFLREKNVVLESSDDDISGHVFSLTHKVYGLLPEGHLGHTHFQTLKIGGWSSSGAGCSEYADPVVKMFDFAVYGPIRNYVSLLLHETGHSFIGHLSDRFKDDWGTLSACYTVIRESGGPFYAVDFLRGSRRRIDAFMSTPDEFGAEFYLFYVTQGEKLQQFLDSLEDRKREPWQMVHDIFKKHFFEREHR